MFLQCDLIKEDTEISWRRQKDCLKQSRNCYYRKMLSETRMISLGLEFHNVSEWNFSFQNFSSLHYEDNGQQN